MRPKTKRILSIYSILVFAFFYIPILVLMVFSFNDSTVGTVWTGFTFEWYKKLISNKQIIDAAINSLFIATVTTVISTVLGTLAALALHRYRFPGKQAVDFLFYIPVIIPDIVVAVALLALFGLLKVELGLLTIIPGHVVIATSFVMLVVFARLAGLDRSVEEAAKDLGANEFTTFFRVTLPLISPGVLAGALLAFTISLDEFVIAFFSSGPGSSTLPVLVYSMVRKGVSPEVNALSTILILTIVIVVSVVGWRTFRSGKSEGDDTT